MSEGKFGDCRFLYFKTRGKWKYDGRGWLPDTPAGEWMKMTRRRIMAANGGNMPGLADGVVWGETIVVLPDESCDKPEAFPHLLIAGGIDD